MSEEVIPNRSSASRWAAAKPVHEHGEADPALGVGLRIEEDLGVTYPVGVGPLEIGGHEVGEVRSVTRTAAPW